MVKTKKNRSGLQSVQKDVQNSEHPDDNSHTFFQKAQSLRFHSLDSLQKISVEEALPNEFKVVDGDAFVEETDRITANHKSVMVEALNQDIDEVSDPVVEYSEEIPEYIVIGCYAPNGLVIRVKGQTILLRGIEDMPGRGVRSYGGVGFTRVSKVLWDYFLQNHPHWIPLQNGTVFVSNNQDLWWEG